MLQSMLINTDEGLTSEVSRYDEEGNFLSGSKIAHTYDEELGWTLSLSASNAINVEEDTE